MAGSDSDDKPVKRADCGEAAGVWVVEATGVSQGRASRLDLSNEGQRRQAHRLQSRQRIAMKGGAVTTGASPLGSARPWLGGQHSGDRRIAAAQGGDVTRRPA